MEGGGGRGKGGIRERKTEASIYSKAQVMSKKIKSRGGSGCEVIRSVKRCIYVSCSSSRLVTLLL